jgi:hypothetical protein
MVKNRQFWKQTHFDALPQSINARMHRYFWLVVDFLEGARLSWVIRGLKEFRETNVIRHESED